MTCDECLARLDGWVDGDLPASEHDAIERHLSDCASCRAEAAALHALLGQARALPRQVLPGRDLWGGIAARLGPPGPSPEAIRTPLARPRRPSIRPLLMAAALGGILFGAATVAVWFRQRPQQAFAAEQARYAAASAALARALAADPTTLAPDTRAVVERTLGILDQAIAEAEAALARDPGNTELEQMLVARYEQRLGLLRRAAATGRRVT